MGFSIPFIRFVEVVLHNLQLVQHTRLLQPQERKILNFHLESKSGHNLPKAGLCIGVAGVAEASTSVPEKT